MATAGEAGNGAPPVTGNQMAMIRKQARLLSEMKGPGRGVLLEHLLSQLAAEDPPTAELFGHLVTGLEMHDPHSLPVLGHTLSAIADSSVRVSADRRTSVDLLLIAPKPVEETAVLAAFGITKTHKVQTLAARHSGYLGEADGFSVLICSPHSDGNVKMALFVAEWLQEWKPRLGALIGMAGGRFDEVSLGDIVLATSIFDFQIVRRIATPSGSVDKNRFVPHVVPDHIRTNFTKLDEPAWRQKMKDECRPALAEAPSGKRLSLAQLRKWKPALKEGIVLAGSTLFEDGSIDETADGIHDRAMAVEMEGAGFAGAMVAAQVPWLSLRGIADMGGHPDYVDAEGKSRTKEWQFAVTFAAAHRLRAVMPDINVLARQARI